MRDIHRTIQPHRTAWQQMTKVPKISGYFWIIKILSTGMGEAASDYLVHRFNPFLAAGFGFIIFVIALSLQLRSKRYNAWIYWTTVSMVAIFGTMAADALHVQFGIPYVATTLLYAISLAVVFGAWYVAEGTLAIHSIHTRRRELFYWAAVLSTFAMGTALGDLTAYSFGWGYFISGLVFIGLFILPGIGLRFGKLSPVISFWFAYIMTRPLGASFADWLGVPKDLGGLNVGRGVVTLVLSLFILTLVSYVSRYHKDSPARL